MAKEDARSTRKSEQRTSDDEEARSLLSEGSTDIDSGITVHKGASPSAPRPPRRQSSFAQSRPDGTPRTPNRVRFEIEEHAPAVGYSNGHIDPAWIEEEDYMVSEAGMDGGRRDSDVQRLPLLTDIEAPSVTVASADVGFNAEDLLESARPKSGMRSAFMNMANSIM